MSSTTPGRGTIRLGLNIPLFVASLISIGVGTFTGRARAAS